MLTIALFSIFTSLCISTSTTDAQGLITVAIHIHLFSGKLSWPAEPAPVLASAASVQYFSWCLFGYEKSKGTTTIILAIVTGKGDE
jgi:hypothetical protein